MCRDGQNHKYHNKTGTNGAFLYLLATIAKLNTKLNILAPINNLIEMKVCFYSFKLVYFILVVC